MNQVTLKDIENRCIELRDQFNQEYDKKTLYMLFDELDFYSDVYKDEYGVRPRGFNAYVFEGLNNQARSIYEQVNALSWQEFEQEREKYLGKF